MTGRRDLSRWGSKKGPPTVVYIRLEVPMSAICPSLVPRMTSGNREKPEAPFGVGMNTTCGTARRYQIPDSEVSNHRGGVWCSKKLFPIKTPPLLIPVPLILAIHSLRHRTLKTCNFPGRPHPLTKTAKMSRTNTRTHRMTADTFNSSRENAQIT